MWTHVASFQVCVERRKEKKIFTEKEMRWLFVLSAASLLLFLSVMRVACMPMDNSAHHHNKHHESHVQSADAGSTLEVFY
jgi:hypothetical protein